MKAIQQSRSIFKVSQLTTLMVFLLSLVFSVLAHANTPQPTRITYYHFDALGSTIAATDEQGDLLWREDYQPYGKRITREDDGRTDLWFTGKQREESIGLDYFGARWYDPGTGRFLSMDPAEPGLNPLTFNRYIYANDNPYVYVDPDGRQSRPSAILDINRGKDVGRVQGLGQPMFARPPNIQYAITGKTPIGPNGLPIFTGPYRPVGSTPWRTPDATKSVTNPVPATLARVVPGNINPKNLGTTADVFVTDAKALQGLNAKQIADKLTIPQNSSGFKVIEFPTPSSGIASPVFRNNPGFVGGGRTAGGAPEFVIPNGPVPAGATTRVVQ